MLRFQLSSKETNLLYRQKKITNLIQISIKIVKKFTNIIDGHLANISSNNTSKTIFFILLLGLPVRKLNMKL